MLPGSTTTAVFTVGGGRFFRDTGTYTLTAIGSPNDEGFVALVTADDGTGLDGTYSGTLGVDFTMNFAVTDATTIDQGGGRRAVG